MNRTTAAISIAAIVTATAMTAVYMHHRNDALRATNHNRAEIVLPSDAAIIAAVRNANVRIDGFSATNVGGIVVLKGAGDAASAEQAATVVRQLGFARVANLIQTKATPIDDESIRRDAERQLAATRALDGCTLRVSCANGILRVEGTATNDLQSDVARNVLRGVGAQQVQIALTKKL